MFLTPHPEDETGRDAGVVECMALDNAGEGWPFTEVGEFSGSSYGELCGRGAGGGTRSPSEPSWRKPFPNTPACEKGYRGTPTSKGCF
jgi:hypothetical protein